MHLGSPVECNVSIDFWLTIGALVFVSDRVKSKFSVLFGNILVFDSLKPVYVTLYVIWMEQNVHNVDIFSVFKKFPPSLFGHLLRLL